MRSLSVHSAASSAASGLDIDWGALALVFVVAFIATVGIVCVYALALRLGAIGSMDEDSNGPAGGASATTANRPVIATIGEYACYAVGIAAVLFGLWLVIPQFHT